MLSAQVGKVKLCTPLLLASGYLTESPNFFLEASKYGCSGMITRSLKKHIPKERLNIPSPRYAVFDDSMLNCEWGNEQPWTFWKDVGVKMVKDTGHPIVVSLSGRELDGCCYLIRSFDEIGVDAFEINVSCSHSGALYGNLNVDIEHLQRLMKKIRSTTKTPIWIKLSYSNLLLLMAKEAERLGADAIVCTNSIGPGMLIDTKTAKPKLGISGGGGGVTGKAIFPIALWCVHQLFQTVNIPIVGCGGIFTANQTIQMFMAGASAVQLYTAPALKGSKIFAEIVSGLHDYFMENSNRNSIKSLIGLTIKESQKHRFSSPCPVVIEEKCTGCRACILTCGFNAIKIIKKPGTTTVATITDNCISCNACAGICPFDAIKTSF